MQERYSYTDEFRGPWGPIADPGKTQASQQSWAAGAPSRPGCEGIRGGRGGGGGEGTSPRGGRGGAGAGSRAPSLPATWGPTGRKVLPVNRLGQQHGPEPTVNACTKGIWSGRELIPFENSRGERCNCLSSEREGIGGTKSTPEHDRVVFSPAVLVCST